MSGDAEPAEGASRLASTRRWKPSALTWTIVALGVVGLVVGLYPTVASWFASYAQSQVVGNYATQINHARPDAATQLALVREHNEALTAAQ